MDQSNRPPHHQRPGGEDSQVDAEGRRRAADYLLRELLAAEDEEHLTYEQLVGYVDGTLPANEYSVIAEHVAACSSCRADVTSVSHVAETLSDSPAPGLPNQLEAAYPTPFRKNRLRRLARYVLPFVGAAAAAILLATYISQRRTSDDLARKARQNQETAARQEARSEPDAQAQVETDVKTRARTNDAEAELRRRQAERNLALARQKLAEKERERRAVLPNAAIPTASDNSGPGGAQPRANEAAAGPAPALVAAVTSVTAPDPAVSELLRAYMKARATLDFPALQALWPSAPESLRSSWVGTSSITTELSNCVFDATTDDAATVSCGERITTRTSDGRRRETFTSIRFLLRHAGDRWEIVSITAGG